MLSCLVNRPRFSLFRSPLRLSLMAGAFSSLLAAAGLIGPGALLAQLPVAKLTTALPAGGKLGTTFDYAIGGADLEEAASLIFSHPGIKGVQKMAPPNEFQKTPQPVVNQFQVTIAADVPVGVYEVRAVGKYGISNPRMFAVSDLAAEVAEKEPNNAIKEAQVLPLESLVNGQADGPTMDWYKITAKKGQRFVVECLAQRIDSQMDASLSLHDAAGKQLKSNRDSNRFDPVLDFTPPADGDYFVKVFDFQYRGGGTFWYRLSAHTRPYIDFILPPTGIAGSKGNYTLYGRNLPGGVPAEGVIVDGVQLQKLGVEIQIPAGPAALGTATGLFLEPQSAMADSFEYRLKTPAGSSNGVLMGFAAAPSVLEVEPNNQADKAQRVVVPCDFAGQFQSLNDDDWISFEAKKGQVFWIELLSHRLGVPSDPYFVVQQIKTNEKGEKQVAELGSADDSVTNIGGQPFSTNINDGAFRFAVPEDGVYHVLVRNNVSSTGPTMIYRLAIRPEQLDFRLLAGELYPRPAPDQPLNNWSVLLRKGGTEAIQVFALRRDGFNGEITVTVEGLPPTVKVKPVVIGAGMNSATLILKADDVAQPFAGVIKIVGKAKIGDAEVAREARSASVVWPFGPVATAAAGQSRLISGLAVAVSGVELAPYTADAGEAPMFEMSRAGKLELPIKITRRGDFKGNVALTPFELPPNVAAPAVTVNGDQPEGKLAVTINPNAPVGIYTFYVRGDSPVPYRRNPEAAAAAVEFKKQIDQIVTDRNALAKKATDDKAAADKAVVDAEAASKAAAEAAKKADEAAKAKAGDKTLAEAAVAAAKVATDAAAKAKAAADAKVVADKAAVDAAAKAKAAVDAQAAAAKAVTDKDAAAKPTPINVLNPATSVTIKITEAPMTMVAPAPAAALKVGGQLDLPVTITRLYGFAADVPLEVILPGGVAGIAAAKVNIPAAQNQGVISFTAAADATVGTHAVTLKATAVFNGQNIVVQIPVMIKVEK